MVFVFPVFPLLCWPLGIDCILFLTCALSSIVANYFIIYRVHRFEFSIFEKFTDDMSLASLENLTLKQMPKYIKHKLIIDYNERACDILGVYVLYAQDIIDLILDFVHSHHPSNTNMKNTEITANPSIINDKIIPIKSILECASSLEVDDVPTIELELKTETVPINNKSQNVSEIEIDIDRHSCDSTNVNHMQYLCVNLFSIYLRDVFLYSFIYSMASVISQWISLIFIFYEWMKILNSLPKSELKNNGFQIFTQLCLMITCMLPFIRYHRILITHYIQYNFDHRTRKFQENSNHSINHKLNLLIFNFNLFDKYSHFHLRELFYFKKYILEGYQRLLFYVFCIVSVVFFPGIMAFSFIYILLFGLLSLLPIILGYILCRIIISAFHMFLCGEELCQMLDEKRVKFYSKWKYDIFVMLWMVFFQVILFGGIRMSLTFYGNATWVPQGFKSCGLVGFDFENYNSLMYFIFISWVLF